MKKIVALLLFFSLLAALVACAAVKPADTPSERPDKIVVYGLSGPTGLGMAKLMADSGNGAVDGQTYEFKIFDSPEAVLPELTAGTCDIAALPTNVAAKLFNKGIGIRMLAVNTLGVLYVLEVGTETVQTVADLKGKTVYATGQGSTPEYAIRALLEKNGLNPDEDVTLVYESSADAVVAHAAEGAILLLPEPKVTAVKSTLENVRVAVDLTEEWDKVFPTTLAQGCVVVRTAFAQTYPEAVESFLTAYGQSVEYVKNNAEKVGQTVADCGIIPKAGLATKAIAGSNLTFLTGDEMKTLLSNFYQVLYAQDKASVGGAVPTDDFYVKQ